MGLGANALLFSSVYVYATHSTRSYILYICMGEKLSGNAGRGLHGNWCLDHIIDTSRCSTLVVCQWKVSSQ